MVERAGLRIGVIGIAATIVDKTMPASFSEGLRFTLGNEELPGYIRHLREEERVDLVVLISHLGFPQDMELAREVGSAGGSRGIDVLLSGHTHNRIHPPARVNDTVVIQSGCHGSFLGRLDLEVEGGRIVDVRHRLITVGAGSDQDPEVEAMVEKTLAPHRWALAEVVGYTDTDLDR